MNGDFTQLSLDKSSFKRGILFKQSEHKPGKPPKRGVDSEKLKLKLTPDITETKTQELNCLKCQGVEFPAVKYSLITRTCLILSSDIWFILSSSLSLSEESESINCALSLAN